MFLIFICRKGLNGSLASKLNTAHDYLPIRDNGEIDVAKLVLKLLPSKEGVVLRRLLMTAVSYAKPVLNYIKMKGSLFAIFKWETQIYLFSSFVL